VADDVTPCESSRLFPSRPETFRHFGLDNEFSYNRVMKGLIPWTSDGYMEVIEFQQKLDQTPKDDWDLAVPVKNPVRPP
jgi:hypothetical protein